MDDEEFVGKYISCLHRYAMIYLEKELKPYNIRYGQFTFLISLYKTNGANQERLAQTIKVNKATATRAIKNLLEDGFVSRQRDAEDKRSYNIFLTEKGREIEPDMIRIAEKWQNILLSDFSDSQRKEAINLLEKMFKNLSEIM
jgi:DNA-binding MarR family transcriptional regulator